MSTRLSPQDTASLLEDALCGPDPALVARKDRLRKQMFTRIASIELKVTAIPVNNYEPSLSKTKVVAPQHALSATFWRDQEVQGFVAEFVEQLLAHLDATSSVDSEAAELNQVHLRG